MYINSSKRVNISKISWCIFHLYTVTFLVTLRTKSIFFRKLVLREISVILNFLFVFLDNFENYWEFFTFDPLEVPTRFTF